MTKPDWCPQDVWEATASVPGVGGGHEMQGYIQSVREGASRAILAERERCAEVARNVRRDVLQANAASREAPALLHVDRVLELIVYPNGNPMYIRPTSPRGTP